MNRLFGVLMAVGCAALPYRGALAQGAPFDEGSFVVTRDGAPVGKEAFRILKAAGKDQFYTSTAQCAFGERRIFPILTADRVGAPLLYQVDVKNGGEVEERLRATGRPGRLHAVLQTRTGESSKEYLISTGAVILDEDVFHQHFFLPLAKRTGDVSVVIPRRTSQVTGRLEERGTEKIKVDGREVSALHLVITLPDGARDLWFDETGRLLKVAVPARGLVALREELPR